MVRTSTQPMPRHAPKQTVRAPEIGLRVLAEETPLTIDLVCARIDALKAMREEAIFFQRFKELKSASRQLWEYREALVDLVSAPR